MSKERTELEKKWIYFFKIIDVNKDGFIEPADVRIITKNSIQLSPRKLKGEEANRQKEKAIRSFQKLASKIEITKQKKISLDDWLNILGQDDNSYFIRWFCVSVVRELFGLVDLNNDGFIDFQEFSLLYSILGLETTQTVWAFTKLDRNGDRMLSRGEIYDAVCVFFKSNDPDDQRNFAFGPYKSEWNK